MIKEPNSADATFAALGCHVATGVALGAKIMGAGAIESEALGAIVRLSDGRQLLDFGSYAVTLLGHRHPAVTAAVVYQLERMPTTTRTLANPVVAELITTLVERTDQHLQRVWLGTDGADAVEVAIKLARRSSGRLRILAAKRAFHGKTLGALAITDNPAFHCGLEPLLDHVTIIDPTDPDAVMRELELGDVAAVIFEPIQGEAGARVLDLRVLRRWASDAHGANAFVISDEVQAGLRRCGPFSPSLDADLDPDAVLFGKALGGAILPLSAMLATDELYAPLASDPTWHTSTFGGHPLACAAGLATLDTIEEAAPAAQLIAIQLERGLRALAIEHPDTIAAIQGAGLLWGVKCVSPAVAGALLIELAHQGLLVSPCLSSTDTIRLLPPMVASSSQIDEALRLLANGLDTSATYLDDQVSDPSPAR